MPVSSDVNPTVARRELANALRQLREQHRYTVHDVAVRLEVSDAQASKLDSGTRGYPVEQVRTLAGWYELDAAELTPLLALATESRRRAWWQRVEVDPAYRSLIGMEQGASSISEFAGAVIPGLLQTPEYARVVAAHGDPDVSAEQIDQALEVRMRRQAILSGQQAPTLVVVIDEAALARGPRKAAVLRAQLEHLYAVAEQPRVTVQVIAFDYGLYLGARSHFILIGRDGAMPDFAYSEETLRPSEYSGGESLARYRRLWEEMRAIALDPAGSRQLILDYLARA